MAKNADSNGLEKTLLLVLSLISVGLLVAIIFVWYSALNKNDQTTKPGDFIQPENQTASPSPTPIESSESSPSSQAQMSKKSSLVLNSPKNEDVVSASTTNVSGTAGPNSAITVTGGKEDAVTFADENGAFSLDVKLDEGRNDLTVSAFDSPNDVSSTRSDQLVSVVYIGQ